MGKHHFYYGILFNNSNDIGNVIKESEIYNNLPKIYYNIPAPNNELSFFKYTYSKSIYPQISCIKLSENKKNIIIRIAEISGGNGNILIEFNNKINKVYKSNILEDIKDEIIKINENSIKIKITPFKLITIVISL